MIPKRAASLATRFEKAIAPLGRRKTGESEETHFKSWGYNDGTSENRHFHIKESFEAALRLKASTVATDNKFEFIVFPLATLYVDHPSTLQEADSPEITAEVGHDMDIGSSPVFICTQEKLQSLGTS